MFNVILQHKFINHFLANSYLFKVNYRNTRKSCEICDVSDVVLVFLLLTLNIFHTFF